MNAEHILNETKSRLSEAFGERLVGLVLYGSEARGASDSDSDIDLLVLLNGPVDVGSDSRRCIDALYDLVLQWERPIHALPVDIDEFQAQEFPLYRRALAEGVSA